MIKNMLNSRSFIILFFLTVPLSFYAMIPGTLDPSFGQSPGLVVTDFNENIDIATALVRQSDNKLVAAGLAAIGGDLDQRFALVRYLPNGTLDTSFGDDGKVTTLFTQGNSAINSLVLQPDGTLVAAGRAGTDFALARYNSDGTLDTSFGNGGKVITPFTQGGSSALALILQPDGKLIAAGQAGTSFALARYNSDGTLDTSFGNGGKVITPFIQGGSSALALILQPDGKLVAAGRAGTSFVLARYNSDGTLDTSFGNGGKVITNFTTSPLFAGFGAGLIIQSDGKLVIACHTGDAMNANFALARYNPDGTIDTSFGTNGEVITNFIQGNSAAAALIIQPNGKLIAAGISSPMGGVPGSNFAIARYNSDGNLDTTFNPNGGGNILSSNPPGTVITSFGTNLGDTFDSISALVLQPVDGSLKLVAAGIVGQSGSEEAFDFGLARYFLTSDTDISPLASAIIAKYC